MAEQAVQAGQFSDFCQVFVAHFADETDPHARFQRFARFMVEELGRPGSQERYTGTLYNALTALRTALKPILEQEALWVIAPAFFGGVSADDTELLLEEFADFVADPEGYEAPDLDLDMDYWDPEDDEEEGNENQDQEGNGQEEAAG